MKQNYQIKVELDEETVKPIIGPYVRRIKELEKENTDLLKNAIAQANSMMKEELEHYRSEMQLVYGRFASKKEKHNYDVFWKKHEKCRKTAKINEGKIPYVNAGKRMIRVSKTELMKIYPLRKHPLKKVKPEPKLYSLEPKNCYTINEMCKKYHMNDSTAYMQIRKYSIPTRQIGNYVYVPKKEIDNLYKSDAK